MGNNFRHAVKFSSVEFGARWNEICTEFEQSESKWIAGLRAKGIKAAHPDDGWVNREENSVVFAYPQFNDGAGIGDLVALGYHFDKTRTVRLIEYKAGQLPGCGRWLFLGVK